jgi:hypothetical protein
MLGYTIFGAYVLRHTWRKERVLVEPPARTRSIRSVVNARVGVLSRSVDVRVLVALTAIAALSGLGYAWMTLDRIGRFAIVAVGVCAMGRDRPGVVDRDVKLSRRRPGPRRTAASASGNPGSPRTGARG